MLIVSFSLFQRILSTLVGYAVPHLHGSSWHLICGGLKNMGKVVAPAISKSPFWLPSGDPVKEDFPP